MGCLQEPYLCTPIEDGPTLKVNGYGRLHGLILAGAVARLSHTVTLIGTCLGQNDPAMSFRFDRLECSASPANTSRERFP